VRGPDRRRAWLKRRLRRDATDAETILWLSLRDRRLDGFKFVRQEAIGPFIVDFVCRERKLVVEVDGGQHSANARDIARDRRLASVDYRVLRFWNSDILGNKQGVLETILRAIHDDES
jgi:very-short-patch-repair endonuclease